MAPALRAALLSLTAVAAAPAPGPLEPVPTDAQCRALPALPAHRLPLRVGERLDYDIDFLGGVKAGTVTLEVKPPEHQEGGVTLPIAVHAESNEFFSKFGKFDSSAVSYLRPRDLHPLRYHEDFVEAGRKYWTDVFFPSSGPRLMRTRYGNPSSSGEKIYPFAADALDVVSAFYVLRSLDLHVGQHLCFDAYSSRTIWRIWGKVDAREMVATPAGNFQALRLAGVAARVAMPKVRRDVYLWVSDDAQRLPVAAIGDLDIGPLRALLSGIGSAPRAARDPPPAPAAAAGWKE
ncbi:MAG TPA: DUF3108 domain-containing protein [Myxococcales bacterium]|nr:DUF3108 domain-containing protein [Myxococcales bacterium]